MDIIVTHPNPDFDALAPLMAANKSLSGRGKGRFGRGPAHDLHAPLGRRQWMILEGPLSRIRHTEKGGARIGISTVPLERQRRNLLPVRVRDGTDTVDETSP